MMTFKQFAGKLDTIPASTAWYLADLGEARGVRNFMAKQKRVIPSLIRLGVCIVL